MLKHERGQYKKIKPKLNKQSRQSPTTHIHSVDVDVGFYCMCEQQKLKRLCAFAQMRSLARAFAIRIQNISTFRRRWRATNVGLYCLCEQQKLKESAQSRYIQNI